MWVNINLSIETEDIWFPDWSITKVYILTELTQTTHNRIEDGARIKLSKARIQSTE